MQKKYVCIFIVYSSHVHSIYLMATLLAAKYEQGVLEVGECTPCSFVHRNNEEFTSSGSRSAIIAVDAIVTELCNSLQRSFVA